MRKPILLSILAAVCLMISAGKDYGQGGHPIPPGVREADKQTNAPLEAPTTPAKPKKADAAQLEREAKELQDLAARIPGQITAVNQGQIPKDLTDQLKQIEKLAKRLRSEIMP